MHYSTIMRYKIGIRKRVLPYLEIGYSKEQIAKLFHISRSTVYRWDKARKEELDYKNPGPRNAWKLDRQKLVHYVESHPEATLNEISAYFAVSTNAVWHALRKAGLRIKKRKGIRLNKLEQE